MSNLFAGYKFSLLLFAGFFMRAAQQHCREKRHACVRPAFFVFGSLQCPVVGGFAFEEDSERDMTRVRLAENAIYAWRAAFVLFSRICCCVQSEAKKAHFGAFKESVCVAIRHKNESGSMDSEAS